MNKNQIIFESLKNEKKIDFLLSCHAKYKNCFGVPRVILDINTNFNLFFSKQLFQYSLQDQKYFEMINDEDLHPFLCNFDKIVIFDHAQLTFDFEDDFFKHLDLKTKKLFNLYEREIEKEKFIRTNLEHYKKVDSIVSQIIKKKLDEVWISKWGSSESYFDRQNTFLDVVINA